MERKARQGTEADNGEVTSCNGTEGDHLPVLVPRSTRARSTHANPPPKGVYFEIKEKERSCHLTDAGVREAEKLAGRRELLHGREHGVAAR